MTEVGVMEVGEELDSDFRRGQNTEMGEMVVVVFLLVVGCC